MDNIVPFKESFIERNEFFGVVPVGIVPKKGTILKKGTNLRIKE